MNKTVAECRARLLELREEARQRAVAFACKQGIRLPQKFYQKDVFK